MPLYRLTDDLIFPPPEFALDDGLLAVGGDLSVERLLLAYSMGIFPWYGDDDPILWWSLDPRMVLYPDEFHVSRRMQRVIRSGEFTTTFDRAFEEVIRACAKKRGPRRNATWITPEMEDAYCELHEAGYAHSVEAWRDGKLAGGLYGVSLGACFFGESMFSHDADASKVALAALVDRVKAWGFSLIDCQQPTSHLESLGAREVPRSEFLDNLRTGLTAETRVGSWGDDSRVAESGSRRND